MGKRIPIIIVSLTSIPGNMSEQVIEQTTYKHLKDNITTKNMALSKIDNVGQNSYDRLNGP